MRHAFLLALSALVFLAALPLVAQQATVRVTGTVYDEYARLVFNAPMDGTFDVAVDGDRLIINFSSPVQPNFREALGPLRNYIANATVQNGGKQLVFRLKQSNVKLRKFRSATFFGVDIVPLGKPPAKPVEAAAKPKEVPKPKDAPKPESKPVAAKETPVKEEPKTVQAPTSVPKPKARPSSIPQEAPMEKAVADDLKKTEAPAAAPAAAAPKQPVVQAGSGDNLLKITFDERVPAALFVRGRTVWAVFAKAARLPVEKLAQGGIAKAVQLPDRHSTILKLTLKPDVNPSGLWVTREQFDWVLKHGRPPVTTPLPVNTDLSEHTEVKVSVLQAAEPFIFTDPEIGDELFVVPVRDPGNLVNPGRQFVDMHLLPTLQGVVIRRVSEATRIQVQRDGVLITSLRGLTASEVFTRPEPEKTANAAVPAAVELSRTSMFPFTANPTNEGFMPGYYAMLNALTKNLDSGRSFKQLAMAEFLFTQELYPEALGVLRQILADDPEFSGSANVRDMIAASQFLMGRYDQAEEAFQSLVASDHNPEFKDEQKLWLWASNRMNAHENMSAPMTLEEFDPAPTLTKYLPAYPYALRRKLLLLQAEQALSDERTGLARQFLETLGKLEPEQHDKDQSEYLHARLLEMERKDDMAIDIYKKLADDAENARVRASAAYSLAKFLKESGKGTLKESIALLERARLEWRGDRLEVDVLRLLGQYYIEDKQYVEGLRAWRTLVSNYAGTTIALEVAGEMAKVYAGLFENESADKMPPVQALGLFFEFNELLPVGVAGDRISRKLAEHLEKVDLLESAAAILTHQVRYRSQGAERAGLAARLVQLHLANNRTDLATEVLDAMAKEQIPESLMAHYRYLRAEALVRQEKYDAALALITSDNTPEVQELKFAIYWYQQQWERIVDILEPQMKLRAMNKDTLTAEEEERVLRLAIGYSRLRRWADMKWLQDAYNDRLKRPEVDEAFDFVTERSATVDHAKLEESLELNRLESFLNSYRKPEPAPEPQPEPVPAAEQTPAVPEGAATPAEAIPPAEPKETPPAEAK